ncbi:uncharacterized protein HHUB_3575 [Halobacterium hubeiense]|uniref:Uncharacterized protein n=1 Tax=Halobacterium hubeiense TaxID=1407499 RepID=A0A0U5H6A6_9EURY|nr:uncharacterized protein HHUB_3575 [Halobacterium hubeiense]
MTECHECQRDGAGVVRVTYTSGETEELRLCTRCTGEYRKGGFVSSVSEHAPTHE